MGFASSLVLARIPAAASVTQLRCLVQMAAFPPLVKCVSDQADHQRPQGDGAEERDEDGNADEKSDLDGAWPGIRGDGYDGEDGNPGHDREPPPTDDGTDEKDGDPDCDGWFAHGRLFREGDSGDFAT